MSNCIAFHTQIASIMEVLANAAVAEICKLVEDGYAVLRLEMTQSQKENEALRRKLQMLELRVARGCTAKARTQGSSANRTHGGRCFDRLPGTAIAGLGNEPSGESVFEKHMDTDLPRDGEPAGLGEVDSSVSHNSCADMEEGRTESLLIKEERLEEDSDPQGRLKIREEGVLELDADDGERTKVVDKQTPPTKGREELTDQQRVQQCVLEVSGLETVLKPEPENNSVNKRLHHRGSEHRAGRLNSLDSECVTYERTSHLGTCFAQGSANTVTEGPSCSYATEMDSERPSAYSELPLAPSTAEGSGNSLCYIESDMKPEVLVVDSGPIKQEAEVSSDWNKDTLSGTIQSQHSHYTEERGEAQTEIVNTVYPQHAQMGLSETTLASKSVSPDMNGFAPCTSESGGANQQTGKEKMKLVCKFCWKDFSRQRHLELHMRVHTGVKPFSCTHCGKRFAHSYNLKVHQSTHLSEREFCCTQCGKSFFSSRDLKKHQGVHTRDRPFVCSLCGKSFVCSSQLKVHQNVHTGERPFCCSMCGKSFSHPSNLKRHQKHHHGGQTWVQSQPYC